MSFLAVVIAPVPLLISYPFDSQVMLILILIDIQYSQNAVFSFEKGLNRQNHSSSRFHQPVKKFLPSNISDSPATGGIYPPPLPLFGKPYCL